MPDSGLVSASGNLLTHRLGRRLLDFDRPSSVLLRLLRFLTLDCSGGEFFYSGILLKVLAFSSTLVWLCWSEGSNSGGDFEFGRGFGCTKESFLSVS